MPAAAAVKTCAAHPTHVCVALLGWQCAGERRVVTFAQRRPAVPQKQLGVGADGVDGLQPTGLALCRHAGLLELCSAQESGRWQRLGTHWSTCSMY